MRDVGAVGPIKSFRVGRQGNRVVIEFEVDDPKVTRMQFPLHVSDATELLQQIRRALEAGSPRSTPQ